jgi:hypothetical protein
MMKKNLKKSKNPKKKMMKKILKKDEKPKEDD